MESVLIVLLVASPSWPSPARGQAKAPPGAAPLARSELLAHFGVTTAPFEVPALAQAKGQAFVFVGSVLYAMTPPWQGELQIPWVLGSVAQPAGSYVDAATLGNPQVGVRRGLAQRTSARGITTLFAGVRVGAPLARHADDLMPNRLLAIADGIEGRTHPELFTPGALPLTPAVAVALEAGRWQLLADLALPFSLRISDAHLATHGATTRRLGLASTLGVEASYRLSTRLSIVSAARLTLELASLARRPTGVSRWQDLERFGLHVRLGPRAAVVIDLQAPLAGPLGGNTIAAGLRLTLDLG